MAGAAREVTTVREQAAQAVVEARSLAMEVKEQAAHAVVEARSQAMEFGIASQAQLTSLQGELLSREAALKTANERPRILEQQLQERVLEIETLRNSLTSAIGEQNGTGTLQSIIDARIRSIEDGLNSLRSTFTTNFLPRLEQTERQNSLLIARVDQMATNMLEDRNRLQDLHAEFSAFRQDCWWEQGDTWATPREPSLHVESPKRDVKNFDLCEEDSDCDLRGSFSGHGLDMRGDTEEKSVRLKDLHHFKVPSGAFRQWKFGKDPDNEL